MIKISILGGNKIKNTDHSELEFSIFPFISLTLRRQQEVFGRTLNLLDFPESF